MEDDLILKTSRWLLQLGRVILVLAALVLMGGFAASLFGGDTMFSQVERELAEEGVILDGRVTMVFIFGIAAMMLIVTERFLSRLLRILNSLTDEGPFNLSNARNLEIMAWLALALQGLGLITTLYSLEAEKVASRLTIDGDISAEGILLVLLLFLLARVFRLGAAMRDDLEGTV